MKTYLLYSFSVIYLALSVLSHYLGKVDFSDDCLIIAHVFLVGGILSIKDDDNEKLSTKD